MGRRLIGTSMVDKVKDLRKKGWSVPEIALEVKMSKTTVLKYVKDVEILPEYVSQWFGKRGGSKRRMYKSLELAKNKAESTLVSLTSRERLLVLCSLYWAEGNKESFSFMNSDPLMVKLFVQLLKVEMGIKAAEIRLNIRIYPGMDEKDTRNSWSELLEVPLVNFGKTEFVVGSKGKLKIGMCRVRVLKGGSLLKYVVALRSRLVELSSPRSSTDRVEVS